MPETQLPYSEEEAWDRAEKLHQKVVSGEASDYSVADKQLDDDLEAKKIAKQISATRKRFTTSPDANEFTDGDLEKGRNLIEVLKWQLERGEVKVLDVEPTMLMHTGGLYDYIDGKIDPDEIESFAMPKGELCFGVSQDSVPESNTSIADYRHNLIENEAMHIIHRRTSREATIIYRKGYHKTLGLKSELVGKIEKGMTDGYAGEVNAPARMIYNVEAIDSIICYSESDAKEYSQKMNEKGIHIPIYIEIENPLYEEIIERRRLDTKKKFMDTFSVLDDGGLGSQVSIPDDQDLSRFNSITSEFEAAAKKAAQERHDILIADAKSEEERINFETYKDRLKNLVETPIEKPQSEEEEWHVFSDLMRKMHKIDDEARRLFGEKIENRQRGISDDHKAIEMKEQAGEVLRRMESLTQYIATVRQEGRIAIPSSKKYLVEEKFEKIVRKDDGPIHSTRWVYVLFDESK